MAATMQNVLPDETTAVVSDIPQIESGDAQRTTQQRSSNPVPIALAVTLIIAMLGIIMWQIDSLGDQVNRNGDRIEANSTRIENLGTQLRAEFRTELRAEISGLRTELQTEIANLRTEMQAGFAAINATLLDHTDRLARLETAVGLPRPNNSNP